MAQSVAANTFRPTAPDSSEQAFMQAALNDGDIKALLEGHNRDAKLAALACLYGGPVTEKIAPFANAVTRIRERWLALHARPDAIDAILCRKSVV